jgi:mono/diheme cytochrome c family protein
MLFRLHYSRRRGAATPNMPLAFAVVLLWLSKAATGDDVSPIDFERQIRPLFFEHCAECHGPKTQKGSLRLDARHAALSGGDSGAVIEPGRSDKSELLRRITSDNADERMPPNGAPLSAAQITLLRQWIDAGATWPESDYDRSAARDRRLDHWAFRPIRVVQPPEIDPSALDSDVSVTMIDRFILAKLAEKGMKPSPLADRRTLARRLWLDMLGLPPSA